MKIVVVSDSHRNNQVLTEILKREKDADLFLHAGDMEEEPRLLFPYICVKGNCEAEVDQMVLNFKIHDYYDFMLGDISIHLEHGHHLDLYNGNAKLILSGHTHIPNQEKINDKIFANPGSITIPKNNSKRGYGILDDDKLVLLTIDDEIVSEINL